MPSNDLARQRRAHEIWVSRSHLYALAAGVVLFSISTFAVGHSIGQRSVDRYESTSRLRLQDQPADDALVELLARVDAAATPDGGLRKLTFPGALAGEAVQLDVPQVAEADEVVVVPGGEADALTPIGDVPKGRWTLAVTTESTLDAAEAKASELRALGLEAWIGSERIEGRISYRISMGGYGSRAEAEDALKSLAVRIGDPQVVRY